MVFIMNYIMEIIFILIGLVSVYLGYAEYEFWIKTVPGGGFMPILAGVLIILISMLVIFDKKQGQKLKVNIKAFYPVFAILAALAFNILVGVLPAITAMVFAWLKWIEKYSYKTAIIVAIITSACAYGIFWVWLRVPFPTGILNINF
jgi:hypothetical protein